MYPHSSEPSGDSHVTLDAGAAAAIRRSHDAGVPPWRSMPASMGREAYRRRTLLLPAPRPGGVVSNLSIPSETEGVGIRVYRPDSHRARAVFVYLHGGGWTFGDLDMRDDTCGRISRAADCVVVSVDYRLAPEHPFPAALDDAVTAIKWADLHRDEIGATSAPFAVGGDSAGGNLTAAACLRLREEGGPKVALQVLIYPALQAFFDTLSYHENGEGYLLTRADLIWFWGNYLSREEDARDPFACPGVAQDLRELPPALIITAGFDPLRDEGEVYGHRLRAAGVPAVVRRFPGMIHNFIAFPIEPAAERAIRVIAAAARGAWTQGTGR